MGTQQTAEGSDPITQPQLICPHLPEPRKKTKKRKGYCLMSLTVQHHTFKNIPCLPESEETLEVAKLKSISGFSAKYHKPMGFLYWRILLWLWTKSLLLKLPASSRSLAFGRGGAAERNCTDHTRVLAVWHITTHCSLCKEASLT